MERKGKKGMPLRVEKSTLYMKLPRIGHTGKRTQKGGRDSHRAFANISPPYMGGMVIKM